MMRGLLWRRLFVAVVAFCAGTMFGAAAMYRGITRHVRERLDSTTWTPRTMDWLESEMKFSAQEAERYRPDVQRAVDQLIALRDDSEVKRKAIVRDLVIELHSKMNPEQQARLEDAIRKSRPANPAIK